MFMLHEFTSMLELHTVALCFPIFWELAQWI